MRLVLSRKGFDSSSGGCPSPIFPDGSMIALPIPDKSSTITYDRLTWKTHNLGDLVARLTKGKQKPGFFAHLDPDLRPELMPRRAGWRPALGQEGSSQTHLMNQGVTKDDLFLFWGLFQRVDENLKWLGSPFHAIWGWLQVGLRADVDSEVLPELTSARWQWSTWHPHIGVRERQEPRKKPNCLYVAADRLVLPGTSLSSVPGAGVLERFRPELQLTANAGQKLSLWSLPEWFEPRNRPPLSYHSRSERWTPRGDRVLLQTVGRGQEFVLDVDQYPEALDWIAGLLEEERP